MKTSPDDATRAEALYLTFEGIAQRLDGEELREAQQAKDAVRAHELVFAALGA